MEGRDGIGGEMVLARTRQAAGGRLRGTQVKAVNPGKATLIAAMDRKVGENSEKIAQKLIDTVLGNDWTGAKLLFAMADGLIDCENAAVVSTLFSYAKTLESEPQVAANAVEETDEDEVASQLVSESAS